MDIVRGTIRLEVGETKNGDGWTLYLLKDEKPMLAEQWKNSLKAKSDSPFVFTNAKGTGPIKDVRGSWNKACRETGLGYGYRLSGSYVEKWESKFSAGPLFHDFRRTAVRNMNRAGISRKIGMCRSGHKTESVYNRYDITDDRDLQTAAHKLDSYLKSQTGTITGTIADLAQKERLSAIG